MSDNETRLPWLCRLGFHFYIDGNCPRCGYRWHGKHVGSYKRWKDSRR